MTLTDQNKTSLIRALIAYRKENGYTREIHPTDTPQPAPAP
jgi:hypothetical protein